MSGRLENVNVRDFERSRPNFTAFITCLGCVVVLLDVSIVNVALQRISDGLGGKVSDLQWIVDAYTLAFASFLLSAGTAGDRYGNKRIFAAGFVVRPLGSWFFGRFADRHGRRPAMVLAVGMMSAGAFAIGVLPSSLSFHLGQLMHAGLITQRRQSRLLIYSAEYDAMNALLRYLTENCCAGPAACAPVCNPSTTGESDETPARARVG